MLNALDPTSSLFETMCSLVIDYSDFFGDGFPVHGPLLSLEVVRDRPCPRPRKWG